MLLTPLKIAEDAYMLMLQMPFTSLRIRNQSVLAQTRDFIAEQTGRSSQDVQNEFETNAYNQQMEQT